MAANELEGDQLVREARSFASSKHATQKDKAGRPYIDHPRRVAERVADFGPEYVAVAWLHDVIEDQGVTDEELRHRGFPEAVVTAVVAMTKLKADRGDDAIERACSDAIALVVKGADVADNTDPDRLERLPPDDRTRLEARYRRYRDVLDAHGAPAFPHWQAG